MLMITKRGKTPIEYCRRLTSTIRTILEARRRRLLYRSARKFYISDTWMYNPTAGFFGVNDIAPGRNAYELVFFMAELLANGTPKKGASHPDSFKPHLLVICTKLKLHKTSDGEGTVIDLWSGIVKRAESCGNESPGFSLLGSYTDARGLARLLEEGGFFQDD